MTSYSVDEEQVTIWLMASQGAQHHHFVLHHPLDSYISLQRVFRSLPKVGNIGP